MQAKCGVGRPKFEFRMGSGASTPAIDDEFENRQVDKVAQFELSKSGNFAAFVQKSWPEEGGNGRKKFKRARRAKRCGALSKH